MLNVALPFARSSKLACNTRLTAWAPPRFVKPHALPGLIGESSSDDASVLTMHLNCRVRFKQSSVAVRRPIRVGWFRMRRSAEGVQRLV